MSLNIVLAVIIELMQVLIFDQLSVRRCVSDLQILYIAIVSTLLDQLNILTKLLPTDAM